MSYVHSCQESLHMGELNQETTAGSGRRKRRFDPLRRERLIEVTLEVIAQNGLAGTSSRKVADAADVSLGSITYYFESLHQLIEEAFVRLSSTISDEFTKMLTGAPTREEAITAVVDIIDQKIWGTPRTLTLSFEFYAFISRNPHLNSLPQRWMKQSRRALEQHFSPTTARAIDAVIEGVGIHNHFDHEPMTRSDIERVIRLVATAD